MTFICGKAYEFGKLTLLYVGSVFLIIVPLAYAAYINRAEATEKNVQ